MKLLCLIATVLVLTADRVQAQQLRQPDGPQSSGPQSAGSGSLERMGLAVGKRLPNLTIFDVSGDEFRIADLKGRYSVIVFGCLT
ncbi:MAG: hypothetical protein R3C53_24565 [Pirellulaceae bacterium]